MNTGVIVQAIKTLIIYRKDADICKWLHSKVTLFDKVTLEHTKKLPLLSFQRSESTASREEIE